MQARSAFTLFNAASTIQITPPCMAQIHIDLVEVFDLASRTLRTFHLSEIADANSPFEWWISGDGRHHALFHKDAYYDEVLQRRRTRGNMICPQDKTQRLVLAGQICRQIDLPPKSCVELCRARLKLTSVSVHGGAIPGDSSEK